MLRMDKTLTKEEKRYRMEEIIQLVSIEKYIRKIIQMHPHTRKKNKKKNKLFKKNITEV